MMKSLILIMSVVALAAWPALAQETAKTETTTTTTTTETSVIATPAEAESPSNWELCPEPSMALTEVPSEMDELQADIDRYTLCLSRAELLLKLEDLKKQNQDAGVDAMSLPVSPAPLTPEQTTELIAGTTATSASAPPPQEDYAIRDIKGMGDMLMARLQAPDGDFEQVQIGDTLADGSEVTAITTTQVTIRKDGVAKRLSWNN